MTTLLAGMSPAITVEGGATAAGFAAYPHRVLVLALRPEQTVVVNLLGAHKPERMHQLIQAAGCEPVFLPAYSSHQSPIEAAFNKIKSRVRAAGARTRTALDAASAAALQAVTPDGAAGWFHRAGCPSLLPT